MRALFVVLALLSATPSWAAGLALVLNSGDATLSVLDGSTGAELRRVPVLREPHHFALSPDGKQLLAGDAGGNEMLFLDPATGDIRRRVPVADPYHLQFSPNGKWLVVTGLARNQVDVYEAASMHLAKRFPASSMPSHIAFSPDSSMAFATLQGTNKLAAYDLNRLANVWTVEVGNTPAGVLWHDDKLLVANMGTDSIVVVDPVDGRVERKIRTGRGAHQIFLAPDGKLLWVNNRVDGTTVSLDAHTLAVLRTYRVPGGPDCIDFAPDGKLWITQRFIQKVGILDPATGALQSVPVGRSPHGIFLTAAAPSPLMPDPFSLAAGWLTEHVLIPMLYALGGMEWEEVAFGWALFACYGAAQVLLTFAICLPLERWRPVEHWPDQKAVWVDVFYTFVSRVGVLPLVTFVLFYQIQVWLNGFLSDHGWVPPTLERVFPFLLGHHLLTFFLYAIILDFSEYWRHRFSHMFGWWWGLHSLHHAQRQMTFWSDDRNHILDDLIGFVWFTAVALLIGIPPLQFPLLVLLLRLLESLSHANTRLSFGRLGERLLISPRFHRAHHGVLAAGQKSANYGAILPWWDTLFGTADFGRAYARTGDPGAPEAMATGTYLQQQAAGFRRMARLAGWTRRQPTQPSGF